MLSNGRSRLDACSEGGVSGFLPRKTMVSGFCASKFPWCKFLFSANVLWYSKTIDLAALRWLSSRGMDKSEIKKALWNFMLIVYFFCQVMLFFAKEGIKRSHRHFALASFYCLFSHISYIQDQLRKCIHNSKPLIVISSCCRWNKQIIILSFVKKFF